jgi:hypothetical protein
MFNFAKVFCAPFFGRKIKITAETLNIFRLRDFGFGPEEVFVFGDDVV